MPQINEYSWLMNFSKFLMTALIMYILFYFMLSILNKQSPNLKVIDILVFNIIK